MKELRNIVDAYEKNQNLTIDEIVKFFGIKPFKSTYKYIDLIYDSIKNYLPVTKNYLFLRFVIFSEKIYDIKSDNLKEYRDLIKKIDEIFKQTILVDDNVMTVNEFSHIIDNYNNLKNDWTIESSISKIIYDTFNSYQWLMNAINSGKYDNIDDEDIPLNEYKSEINFKNSRIIKQLVNNFDLKYHGERYFVKNNLYDYDMENDELRLGRGNIVGKCIPIDNLPNELENNTSISVINPRTNKNIIIKIIKSHSEDEYTYLSLINGNEEWICNSDEVDDAYDALFNINRYIFAGYNWKRRKLIYNEKK